MPDRYVTRSGRMSYCNQTLFLSRRVGFGDKTTWRTKACQYFFTLDLIPSNTSQKCVSTVPQSACSQVSTVLFYALTTKFVWAQICVGDMHVCRLQAKGWQCRLSQNIGPEIALLQLWNLINCQNVSDAKDAMKASE